MRRKLMLRRFSCVSALLLIPAVVFAVSGWTDHAPVVELTPTIHGRFLLELKVTKNPSGCKNKEVFYQDYNIPGSEQIFQTLLEAVASKKMVRVYVTGKCEINGYSEISSVAIVP